MYFIDATQKISGDVKIRRKAWTSYQTLALGLVDDMLWWFDGEVQVPSDHISQKMSTREFPYNLTPTDMAAADWEIVRITGPQALLHLYDSGILENSDSQYKLTNNAANPPQSILVYRNFLFSGPGEGSWSSWRADVSTTVASIVQKHWIPVKDKEDN